MNDRSRHLRYSDRNNKPYSGHEKNRVPGEDPDLTHTDPGTPMGEFMRRFWQPMCLSQELTDVPKAIRIMSEELVAFRDKSGQVGVLHRHCCHRGASLEFGIIQEKGICCCYHGFHYDVDGTLIDVPGEADRGKRLAQHTSQGAYPAFERDGLVFAYMGPSDEMPEFPEWDYLSAYDDLELVPFTNVYPCNYLQIVDNGCDQIHTAHLHHERMRVIDEDEDDEYPATSLNPVFTQEPVMDYAQVQNDTGVVHLAGRRVGSDRIYMRMTHISCPNVSWHPYLFEDAREVRHWHRVHMARWYVPFDNDHSQIIGWRMFGRSSDPFDAGHRERCGLDDVDFLDGQTGHRSYHEAQRAPGDWEAIMSQRPIAVHALENPMRADSGVYMNRQVLRRALRGENPHAQPDALNARANAGRIVPTYANNSVLRIPMQDGRDDTELVRTVCRQLLDIISEGDQHEGADRDAFIHVRMRNLERSHADQAAAE